MLTIHAQHILSSWLTPSNLASRLGRSTAEHRAKRYLEREGALGTLVKGTAGEIRPHLVDLANLHRLIRRRRPSVVLEFGVGFSTIAIAHALACNAREAGPGSRGRAEPISRPRVWAVDTSEEWLENTRKKVPAELKHHLELRHSPAHAIDFNGQLCSAYETLPNIVPDFMYLDGPSPSVVQGSVRGISFVPETGGYRHPAAADIMLLESTLQVGAFILVDSRYINAHFLAHNLRRRYRIRWNWVHGWVTFELLEWTGRSRASRAADEKKR